MKITVINKRPTTGERVSCVDGTTVEPGSQHEMLGRSVTEAVFQLGVQDDDVAVNVEIEGDDRAPVVCVMKSPADPAGGAATLAAVGFDILTEAGAAANVAPQMYMGVFDDEDCQTPAVTGQLSTAVTGTIDSGTGTNLVKCTPDAAGEFSCSVDDAEDETVYLKAWIVGTGYIVDSSSIHDVTFTA